MADAAATVGGNSATQGGVEASAAPTDIPQPITCAHLESRLRAGIANVEFLNVVDDSDGCGSKFKVIVVFGRILLKLPLITVPRITGPLGTTNKLT